MKFLALLISFWWGLVNLAGAQDQKIAVRPAIIGPVADGTPAPPPPLVKTPDFVVETTQVQQRGGHKVFLHQVVPPVLPVVPPPPTSAEIAAMQQTPAWQARLAKRRATPVLYITATVYDHRCTFLSCQRAGPEPKNFEAWSNLDFNLISGIQGFEADGVSYSLILMVENIDSLNPTRKAILKRRGLADPVPPPLPTGRAAFKVMEGNTAPEADLAPLQGLHALYDLDKDRLLKAWQGRQRAAAAQEAALKNPLPVPVADTHLYIWPRQQAHPQPSPLKAGTTPKKEEAGK